MKISLLEMGKIKKRNVREAIISTLTREFPLSIKKIYNKVKKDYSLDVTYQAVFKVINEMVDDNVLEKKDREYKLNIDWIRQLEDEVTIIKSNYGVKTKDYREENIKQRVNDFVANIGPKVKDYFGKDEGYMVIMHSGGARLFGNAVLRYLLREGVKISYVEIDELEQASKEKLMISKKDVENKKVLIVDSAIYSGKTYNFIMGLFNKERNRLKIKDIKYAVDKDLVGLADFSRI